MHCPLIKVLNLDMDTVVINLKNKKIEKIYRWNEHNEPYTKYATRGFICRL